jgi:Ca2+-binding EF-hand superfamily protein
MGICTSYIYTTNVYDNDNVKKDKKQFEALQLTSRDVGRLYNIFQKVDVDGSGTIALAELLAHIDVERTQFSQRVFSIFDEDGSGEIDFREFVLALWNYCTLSRATLGERGYLSLLTVNVSINSTIL